MNRLTLNNAILVLVVLLISVIFISMIRDFIMVILLTAIFAAIMQPVYLRFERWFKGRKNLSSALTILLISVIIFLPLLGLFGIIAGQAIKINRTAGPWIKEKINDGSFDAFLQKITFYDSINEYQELILQKGGELVSQLSTILFQSLSSFTLSTVNFIFLFFVFLYTMFFFLKDGRKILERILFYLPLTDRDEQRLLEKFSSVTRATIRGVLLIGVIQGGLAGLAFWIVGIDSALFWGTLMTVLSIIPVVGSGLIWFPAVVILAASGYFIKAIGLLIFCGLLVGSVDNILRPVLIGKDTKMHELLIFFGTIGGISLFGIVGFIVGPIIAALFITVWDIYGETFKDYLPEVKFIKPEPKLKSKKKAKARLTKK